MTGRIDQFHLRQTMGLKNGPEMSKERISIFLVVRFISDLFFFQSQRKEKMQMQKCSLDETSIKERSPMSKK